jgi:hypothetical protein
MCRQSEIMATRVSDFGGWHPQIIMGQEGIVTEKIEYGVRSTEYGVEKKIRQKTGRSRVNGTDGKLYVGDST